MPTDGPAPRRYPKPVVVPERLELLTGATNGVVQLPRRLKWSGNPRYDLNEPGRIVDLYRAVLNEATTQTDLYAYLERSALTRLWATLWLPMAVRHAWEQRFPELATRSPRTAA